MPDLTQSLTTGERDRWRRLAELVDMPRNDAEAQLDAFLARWLMPASITTFATVVRRSNGRACGRPTADRQAAPTR